MYNRVTHWLKLQVKGVVDWMEIFQRKPPSLPLLRVPHTLLSDLVQNEDIDVPIVDLEPVHRQRYCQGSEFR